MTSEPRPTGPDDQRASKMPGASSAGRARAKAGDAAVAVKGGVGGQVREMGSAPREDDPRHWRALAACCLAIAATAIVLSTILVVYTAFESRRVTIDLGVDPAADLDAVSQILVDAVSAVETVLADPAPVVIARSFGDGSINLSVRFWYGPDTHSDTAVTDQAIRALNDAISKAGIGLPAPQLMIQTQVSHSDTKASHGGGKSDPSAS